MNTDTRSWETALQKAWDGERLSIDEGLALYDADLLLLGKTADRRRKQVFSGRENIITFAVNLNLNFTNLCYIGCDFCAFFRKSTDADVYLLSQEEILNKIEQLVQIGGTEVLLQGGLHPACDLDYFVKLFKTIHERFPQIYIHSLSCTEIVELARRHQISVKEVLETLKSAGLKSIPGAAEILVDRVRGIISPRKPDTAQWMDCMETAHQLGMESTATMTFGMIETHRERIEHMAKIRDLQDRTHGFRAFIAWTFSPAYTKLSHLKQTGGVEYLRTVAIARLMLDNISHITSGYVTEGMKMAQVALSFGCDDMGGTLMQEEVVAATGSGVPFTNKETLIRTIRDAGLIPAQRNSEYEILQTFDEEAQS